jgi:oligopeptide/dipeptide ABC transporter ATP-binding protein
MTQSASPVFEAKDLRVDFDTPDGEVNAVQGISLQIQPGQCVGIVGESGSGKSQSFLAAMGLLAGNGRASGSIKFRDTEILGLPRPALNQIRGARMTMIFQDPLTSLTPHKRVGQQLLEVLRVHKNLRGEAAIKHCVDWLDRVRLPEAARRMRQYPHELSGGMRQRVMIAMSMLCDPELLIADEPTTALDVTVQAQVLDLMNDLKRETGAAIALITHDMGVVARMCDYIYVMEKGKYVEANSAENIFYNPSHDYTKMLLSSMPRLDKPGQILGHEPQHKARAETLLEVRDVKVHFPVRVGGGLFPKTRPLRAVDGVSFDLNDGETLGIVGESGCGKSTLARAILRLVPVKGGSVSWIGSNLLELDKKQMRARRKDLQIVFQDPLASLDPRMTIGQSIAEPLQTFAPELNKQERREKVAAMLEKVDLSHTLINRYPHELSGGQNQRVGIARAMIGNPSLVICDEAVSALDVTVQAQVIQLLDSLQKETGMSMLFISHDLAVVREISHRVLVLYMGRIVELADRDTIYADTRHPYTKALIAAVPIPDPKVEQDRTAVPLVGDLPSPMDSRAGLQFLQSRIEGDSLSAQYRPQLVEVSPKHFVAEHDPCETSDGLLAP